MPIYQYDCAGCEQRVDVFFRSAAAAAAPSCPECGATELTRVMSQFARTRTATDRLDSINFDQEMGRLGSGDEGDYARWARRMGKQYDGELGPISASWPTARTRAKTPWSASTPARSCGTRSTSVNATSARAPTADAHLRIPVR